MFNKYKKAILLSMSLSQFFCGGMVIFASECNKPMNSNFSEQMKSENIFEIEKKIFFSDEEFERMAESYKQAFDKDFNLKYFNKIQRENNDKKYEIKNKCLFILKKKAIEKDESVSYAIITPYDDYIWVNEFWTVTSCKGVGNGKRLLLYLLNLSSKNKKSLLLLSRFTDEAKEFYKKFMNYDKNQDYKNCSLNFNNSPEQSQEVLSKPQNQELLHSIKNLDKQLIKL